MLSRVIDYVYSRPEVDKSRVEFHGVSWGAYWGTKMAILEKDRLKAVSVQSPPIHDMFQREFVLNNLQGNREYLFDQLPAMMSIFDNVNNLDELLEIFPKMSLVTQGLIGKPTAPMLMMSGVLDTQVPISDIVSPAKRRRRPQNRLDQPAWRASGAPERHLARSGDV